MKFRSGALGVVSAAALLLGISSPSSDALAAKCVAKDPRNKAGERHGLTVYCLGNGQEETPYVNGKITGTKRVVSAAGKVEEETAYVNDIPTGPHKRYFSNGKVEFEEVLANYKKNGLRQEYSDEGHVKLIENYKDGNLNGEVRKFFDDGKFGKVEEVLNYKDDKKHGTQTTYYENGKVREFQTYKAGELDGKSATYSETGKLMTSAEWKDGKKQGWTLEYYDNTDGYYLAYARFEIAGDTKLLVNLYANGKVDHITCYVNGKESQDSSSCKPQLDGLKKVVAIKDQNFGASNGGGEFYANGKPKSKCPEKGGKRHGKCIFYFESGKPSAVYNYVDGQKTGEHVEYYDNGKAKRREAYSSPGKLAKVTEFFEAGQKRREADVKNDQEVAFKEWFQNGEIKSEGTYISGGIKMKSYYDNGELRLEETRKIGSVCYWDCWSVYKPDGLSKAYDSDGKLASTVSYKDGERDGKATTYYPNGKPSDERVYKSDRLVSSKSYSSTGKLTESIEYFEDGSKKVKKAKKKH